MKKLLLAFGGVVLLAGAGSLALPLITGDGSREPIMVDPPDDVPEGLFDYPKTLTSRIAVKLELPIEALAAAANRNAPKEFTGAEQKDFHQRIRNGRIQYRMLPGDISLQNTGQNLGFTLPLRGTANVAGNVDLMIIQLPVQGTANLTGEIAGTVRPQISTDWEIEPNLDPELFLSHADLTLGKIGTINATKMIQDLANPVIKREAANIGPSIMEGLDLKKKLQKFWDDAHLGEQISADPAAWFVFDPHNVSLGPIDYSDSQMISVTMGMETKSYVSSAPVNSSYPEPLPPLDLALTDPVNDVQIPVIVDVAELNRKLATRSFSQAFGIGGTAVISAPEVRVGRKGFVIFGVTLDADTGKFGKGFNGRIWIEAKPGYNEETGKIQLDEVRLTEKTRRALPRPVAKMIERMVSKSIEKSLQADLQDYLPGMEADMQKFLASDKLPEDIEITIPKPELKILNFYTVTRSAEDAQPSPGIVIVLGAKGDINVRLKKL